jgi:RimJ/RimL family protein N-acetyltransferase
MNLPEMPLLKTARLRLRLPEPGDTHFLLRLLNDPDWLRYIGDRGVRNEADALVFIEQRLLAAHREHGFGLWVVEALDGGAALGLCGLLKRDELPDADLGYAFLPEARGHGFAFEAAQCALRFATGEKSMRRVLAIVQADNQPSRQLLEKLGMHFAGVIRFAGRDTCLYQLDAD